MVQEITTTSWGSRILGAIWGMLIGVGLMIIATYGIFWNEGHGLHTGESLEQTEQVLISVPNSPIDPNNNLHVVYISGLATTTDLLRDELFSVSENALKLERGVQMYQWKEDEETSTQKNLGGSEQETKNYTYKQVWSDSLINSSDFKDPTGHQNPTNMGLEARTQFAPKVTVGDFIIPSDLVSQMTNISPVDLSQANTNTLQISLNKPIKHVDKELYVGANPQTPAIGDLKITVNEILPQTVSIIAQQTGNSLQAYMAPAGKPVSLIVMGEQSPQEMINTAIEENQFLTWIIRLITLAIMMMGVGLLMRPIVVIADFIPFLGSLLGIGTGMIAFVCGLALWAIFTAIAWFAIRPLWAIVLIVIVATICFITIKKKRIKTA